MTFVKACALATAFALCSQGLAFAQQAPTATAPTSSATPDVATLLFGNPQWAKAPAGSVITYAYSKKTSEAVFGPSFDDKIVETLTPGPSGEADRRSVEVQMFSGANAKPAGPFDAEAQNPVLLLVLEENVQELSKLFKANPRYIKNAIRKAWRDDAKVESASVEVDGKSVPGTRITVTPFVGDGEKDKMMGLDGMAYVVEIADSVPGQIASIVARAPATGAAKFSETLRFVSEKTP